MESSERFQHPDNLARQSSKGGPPEPKFSKLEISAAVTLTTLALGFHLIRLFKAGALWRDEAAAVQLATMPHVSDMLKFFPHEAFPLLFSAMIRLWANAFGDSDSVWRIFGFLIGCSIIGALWRVALRVGRRVPLVSLALLAFNGAFLEWGDSVRAYGIGTLLILLTIGFLWRVIEKPGVGNLIASVFCAVASVHCLFQNAVFLFAVCTGATVVGIHRCWCGRMAESLLSPALSSAGGEGEERAGQSSWLRSWPLGNKARAMLPLVIGFVAAISLLPYWKPLSEARDWDKVIQFDLNYQQVWVSMARGFSSSGACGLWIWLVLILLGLAVLGIAVVKPRLLNLSLQSREGTIFAGTALIIGLVGYFFFLKLLSHPVRAWHLVVLLGFSAALVDLVLQSSRHWHWRRADSRMPGMPPAAEETVKTVNVTSPGSDTQLKQGVNERSNGFWNRAWGCGGIAQVVIALVISIAGFMPTWQVAKTRQTNIDLVANSLRQLASPDDLVVVVPWYDGISFQRYFKGPAIWTTAPPMGFNLFHRYDLIKSLMVVSNQEEVVKPVLAQIETCFQAGHRVWLVGEGALPRPEQRIRMLPGAPAKPFGWHEQPYTLTWTLETQLYLRRRSVRIGEVAIPSDGPVNPFENLWLKVFEGK